MHPRRPVNLKNVSGKHCRWLFCYTHKVMQNVIGLYISGNISPNTPRSGSINDILYRKTKMFMQNLKHKRVHILLSVLRWLPTVS